MKTKSMLLVLSLMLISVSCEKQKSDDPEVERYISQLKSNQFDSYDIPEFQSSDIPTLLKYIKDTTSITNFPRNGISSFMQLKCKLGMVVLWTIESIRAVDINSDRLIGRFPSQNPILALRDNPSKWVFDYESQLIASKAYYEWWNSSYLFKDKMKTDPLKYTPFIWH